MKKITLLLFLVFSNTVFSQRISGFLLDSETKEPIYRAHIKVDKKIYLSNNKIYYACPDGDIEAPSNLGIDIASVTIIDNRFFKHIFLFHKLF